MGSPAGSVKSPPPPTRALSCPPPWKKNYPSSVPPSIACICPSHPSLCVDYATIPSSCVHSCRRLSASPWRGPPSLSPFLLSYHVLLSSITFLSNLSSTAVSRRPTRCLASRDATVESARPPSLPLRYHQWSGRLLAITPDREGTNPLPTPKQ